MEFGEQIEVPAVYMRGGTSRALVFHARDLSARDGWDRIFLAAMGSPDPQGRQLDGLGGGVSSLSKVAVVGPPSRDDADVDYTFGQVAIDATRVGYRGNCGNISSAIGPFAIDEGLVPATGDRAQVRIHNTNTGKLIVAEFPLAAGKAAVHGACVIQGVAGSAAPIKLSFLDPGGATTGRLLPTGAARDRLDVPACGAVEVSLVDAANPVVFARASAFGLTGDEKPEAIGSDTETMRRLDALRVAAALAMGVSSTAEEARTTNSNLPLVALVSRPPMPDAHLAVRMISAGLPHKATPLTGALCAAVASRLPDSLVAEVAESHDDVFRLAHPEGVMEVAAEIGWDGGQPVARSASVFRTARRLMAGAVLVPA